MTRPESLHERLVILIKTRNPKGMLRLAPNYALTLLFSHVLVLALQAGAAPPSRSSCGEPAGSCSDCFLSQTRGSTQRSTTRTFSRPRDSAPHAALPTYSSVMPTTDFTRCIVEYDSRRQNPPQQVRLRISSKRGEAIFFSGIQVHQYEWFEGAAEDHQSAIRSLEELGFLGRATSVQSAADSASSTKTGVVSEILSLQCETGPQWRKDLLLLPNKTPEEKRRIRDIRNAIQQALATAKKRAPFPIEGPSPPAGGLEESAVPKEDGSSL